MTTITGLPAGAALAGTENLPADQQAPATGIYSTVYLTAAQISTFVSSSIRSTKNSWSALQTFGVAPQFSTTNGFGNSVVNPGTGYLESVLVSQTKTGASYAFGAPDLFMKTRRSNAGSAMSDAFPAASVTGMAAGARIVVANVDATASITVTAGSGTVMPGGGATDTIGPGRDVAYEYDPAASPTPQWRGAYNTRSALLSANNLSDVGTPATALSNLAGAPLASPALTGVPTAPTATAGTNTTQLATTAFVATSFAPLASPALSGSPTAPTQTAGDSSTKIATDAFVANAIATAGNLILTGGFINKFRNGTMGTWQRGVGSTSISTAGAYDPDGWIILPSGASVAAQQAGGRMLTKNSLQIYGAASVTDLIVKQRIEGAVAAPLASQTITLQAQIGNLNYPLCAAIGVGSSSSGGTCTITSVTAPAGALIVVLVTENAGAIGTMADGTNGSYAAADSATFNAAGDVGGVFYFANSSALSGATITYTKHTSGDSVAMSAFYATGMATTSVADSAVTASATGSSTAPSVVSGTPGALNDLIVGAMFSAGAPTYTQAAGFATPPTLEAISTTLTAGGGVMVNTLEQPVTFAPTLGTSEAWLAMTVGFKAAIPSSITPTLTVKHPGVPDNWSSTLTTDVSAVSLQACAGGAWTLVSYTAVMSALAGNGLEIGFDFGNNFGAAKNSIQITELDIRVTPGVSTGLNSTSPPPELRPIFAETQFNQRYYETSYDSGTAPGAATHAGMVGNGSIQATAANSTTSVPFRVTKRADPTMLFWDGAGNANAYSTFSGASSATWTDSHGVVYAATVGENGAAVGLDGTAGAGGAFIHFSASAEL